MVMYSGQDPAFTQILIKLLCTLASSDGDILYCHLLGGVLPGNSSILCLISHSCGIDSGSNTSANSVHKSSQW